MKQASGMSEKTSQMILAVICGIALFIVAYPLYYVVVDCVFTGMEMEIIDLLQVYPDAYDRCAAAK